MKHKNKSIFWILTLIFFLIINYPILGIFDMGNTINGLPTVVYFLFSVWLIFIVLLAYTISRYRKNSSS